MSAWNRYWFGLALSRSKLNLFRVVFFAVLAVDCFLDLSHAPRYGAGDFNVSHLSWMDGVLPLPSRLVIAMCCLIGAYLALQVVFGVAIDVSVRLLTALFGYRYFISQLDSYQHHYLVFLLLVIACVIPWEQARARASKKEVDLRHWAIRLLVVQVAIVYLWAAISKMTGHWVDGLALERQISKPWAAELIRDTFGFAAVAKLVLMTELALAVILLFRRLWPVALVLGVPFHLAIELSGFRIGLFSYFMFAFYLLLLPDRWLEAAGAEWRRRITPVREAVAARLPRSPAALGIGLALVAGGSALLLRLPFEGMLFTAAATTVIGVVLMRPWTYKARPAAVAGAGAAHLVACAVLLLLHATTDQAFDYYKYLGGSARRLGDPELAEHAYRRLLRIRPGYGRAHFHLGNLALARGETEPALEHFRAAQSADPPDGDSFQVEAQIEAGAGKHERALELVHACQEAAPEHVGCVVREALTLQALGRRDQALQAARRAVAMDPKHQAARKVLRSLGGKSAPAPRPERGGGDPDGHDHDSDD